MASTEACKRRARGLAATQSRLSNERVLADEVQDGVFEEWDRETEWIWPRTQLVSQFVTSAQRQGGRRRTPCKMPSKTVQSPKQAQMIAMRLTELKDGSRDEAE